MKLEEIWKYIFNTIFFHLFARIWKQNFLWIEQFSKAIHEASLSCWNWWVWLSHIFASWTVQGLPESVRDGIPFLLKKLDELSQVSCKRMMLGDVPVEWISEVLDGRQIWWLSWPVHPINLLLLQEISDGASTLWTGFIILHDWTLIHGLLSRHDDRMHDLISVPDCYQIFEDKVKRGPAMVMNPSPHHHRHPTIPVMLLKYIRLPPPWRKTRTLTSLWDILKEDYNKTLPHFCLVQRWWPWFQSIRAWRCAGVNDKRIVYRET